MRRPLLFLPALLALLVAPPVAFADPEPEVSDEPDQWDRFLGVELVGGADTPWGVLGGSVRIAPHENLVFDLGAGGSRDGARIAGGVTFQIPDREFAFQLRGGIAGGPLSWGSVFADEGPTPGSPPTIRPISRSWDFTAFLDVDIGLEWRHPSGFGGRIFFGVEQNLIDNANICRFTDDTTTANCAPSEGGRMFRVYLGMSVSYSFELFR